jgi:hypothetical protein
VSPALPPLPLVLSLLLSLLVVVVVVVVVVAVLLQSLPYPRQLFHAGRLLALSPHHRPTEPHVAAALAAACIAVATSPTHAGQSHTCPSSASPLHHMHWLSLVLHPVDLTIGCRQ